MGRASRNRLCERGMAFVLALVFLTTFAAVAVVIASASLLELKKSGNASRILKARLAAEGGLALVGHVLGDVRLPWDVTAETLMDEVHAALGARLDGTGALAGQVVSKTGDVVTIPQIDLGDSSISCTLTPTTDGETPGCWLTVTGSYGSVSRRVAAILVCGPRPSSIFDHAVVSRGPIAISGNAHVFGKSSADEGSVLSASLEPVAIEAGGHATISGDLYITADDVSQVDLSGGGLSIGGSSDIDEILRHHVHPKTEMPEFSETNTDLFADLPTSVIDANTDLDGTNVYTNVRVKAGTDPQFTSDTVINGVMYVESPNKILFTASTIINGIIVTDGGDSQPLSECQIDFRGHTTAPGVEALPDTAEFADIKKLTGTILLAPGFDVTFRGATNAINGTIAADKLSLCGNMDISGSLTGTILGLSEHPVTLQGNTSIRVDHADTNPIPVGFKHPIGLSLLGSSYVEVTAAAQ